ncbi:hypothetical protein [Roseomonas sp. AR75]|uniref:hypothetical protein n=1 Tax=Roseomonas sp. AR75 TaxID=2562311 RepID=UPI0010BF8D1C|nr:hypothetical protein [Roseomonas sp. AR75]
MILRLSPGADLDAALLRGDVMDAMDRPSSPPSARPRPMLALLPWPARRGLGLGLLTLTLWLASFLALVRG